MPIQVGTWLWLRSVEGAAATNPPSGLTEVKNALIQILLLFLSWYIDIIPSIQVYNSQKGLSLEKSQEPKVLQYILDIFNNLTILYLTNLYGRWKKSLAALVLQILKRWGPSFLLAGAEIAIDFSSWACHIQSTELFKGDCHCRLHYKIPED